MTTPSPVPQFLAPYFGSFLQIDLEYPDSADGASHAKFVRAEDRNDYIIKEPKLTPEHRLVAANELIAVQLAAHVGIPVREHAVLAMGPDLFFGSSRMIANTFETLTEALYRRCGNRSIIYQVVAFDVWLINGDRHNGNLLARVVPGSKPSEYALLANDHSHCLVWPREDASVLTGLVGAPLDCTRRPPFVKIPFIRGDIVDGSKIHQAIDQIESITDQALDAIVNSVPDGLIDANDRVIYGGFLKGRRDRLRKIFHDGGSLLPNLTGI